MPDHRANGHQCCWPDGGSFSTESELLLAFIESDEVPSSIKDGDGEIWALNIQGFEGTEDFYTYELK